MNGLNFVPSMFLRQELITNSLSRQMDFNQESMILRKISEMIQVAGKIQTSEFSQREELNKSRH